MRRTALAGAWMLGVGGWLAAVAPAVSADAPAPCPTPCLALPRPAPTPAPVEAAPPPAPRPVVRNRPVPAAAPVSTEAAVPEAPPRPPASRRCIDINMRAAVGEPLSAQDMAYLRSEC